MPLGCIPRWSYWANHDLRIDCLPSDAQIGTPKGNSKVSEIKIGDLVWSVDSHGQKVAVPVLRTSKVAVPENHVIKGITLVDGRTVSASALHPTADGRNFGTLKIGDLLDGSVIVNVTNKPYFDGYTYDILPDSPRATYWADGVRIGSTLTEVQE